MENKKESNNFHQIKGKEKRGMDGSDLECEPNQSINLSQPEYIGQSEEGGFHHIKSYNCNEINTTADPLKDPIPVVLVRRNKRSELPESQSQDSKTLPGNTSVTSDESANKPLKTQILDENDGSESGERQSLVFNLKDKGGISMCGKDNSEVLMRLREGVSDIAKVYTIQENVEKEEDLPDEHLRSMYTTRREDAGSYCEDPSAEDGIRKFGSQIDLSPANVEVMEGCKSCNHIYKGTSKQSNSNSQTQTASHITRTIVTDTKTSTHTTCSSQTVTMGQRNRSAQTACLQATQECQASPASTTVSCQTSVPKSDKSRKKMIKPWAARKYNDMCICAELGTTCTCATRNVSSWEMFLPRNSSWWPTVKKIILIIAAIIPFIFLIVYSIYYFRFKV